LALKFFVLIFELFRIEVVSRFFEILNRVHWSFQESIFTLWTAVYLKEFLGNSVVENRVQFWYKGSSTTRQTFEWLRDNIDRKHATALTERDGDTEQKSVKILIIVKCFYFTHYKVSTRQTFEWLRDNIDRKHATALSGFIYGLAHVT
jgi:hypothetical protein